MFPGGGPVLSGAKEGKEGDDEKETKATSKITVTHEGKSVLFTVDLALDRDDLARLKSITQSVVASMRGEMDLAAGERSWERLSRAALKLLQEGTRLPADKSVPGGNVPPGAFPRPANAAHPQPWAPNDRVSWMAHLLPHLGQGNTYQAINFAKSWRDHGTQTEEGKWEGGNWMAARTLIPEFLDPSYPPQTRYVRVKGMPFEAAATHLVGIAGVGEDAADYQANDPEVAAKVGVFGYDRVTPLDKIPNKANTVLLAQVPPTFGSAWMAGGGSTLRGVPEKGSVKPFVCTTYNDKKGTFVVMVDGSVRFVPETIPDDLFKAMCTLKGGDPRQVSEATVLVYDPQKGSAPAPENKPAAAAPVKK